MLMYLITLISTIVLSSMALRQHYGSEDLLLFRTPWLCGLVSAIWLAMFVGTATGMLGGMGSMGSVYMVITSLALPLIISSPYVLAAVPCVMEPFREANFDSLEDPEALVEAQRLLDEGKRHEAHALLTTKIITYDQDLNLRRLLLPLQIEHNQSTAVTKNANAIYLHTNDPDEAKAMIDTVKSYDKMLASKMEDGFHIRFEAGA